MEETQKSKRTTSHCFLKADISILVRVGHFYFGLTITTGIVDKAEHQAYIRPGYGDSFGKHTPKNQLSRWHHNWREVREIFDKMKSTWPLIIAAAVIIVVLVFLSSIGKKAPFIPPDSIHSAITAQESCEACHAPGNPAALKVSHPPKEQCLICHKVKKS